MSTDTSIIVVKRDGTKEPLTVEKYDRVCTWACEDIKGVSSSELALNAYSKLYNGITTNQIHETLIDTAFDLIDEHNPNYDKVASRLVSFQIRKAAFGHYEVPSFLSIVKKNVELGLYDPEILEMYTEEELEELGSYIDHKRDDKITYAGIVQFKEKYLVRDKSIGQLYESPQIRYMVVSAVLHAKEADKIQAAKNYYDDMSKFFISIPTPVASGVGTVTKQFSSCVLIPASDDLRSINAAASSIVNYASKRAGIGVDVGRIRGIKAKVGRGFVEHTGLIPFIKYFRGALKSCSQGGVRGASATVHFPWFHYEFEELVVLKNNKGTEETRERHLDYCVQFNDFYIQKLLKKNEEIYLFCPKDVPDLMAAFYEGKDDKFEELYYKYAADQKTRKRTMSSAMVHLMTYLTEWNGTGRVYSMNMSAVTKNGPFRKIDGNKEQISSNLCQEIALKIRAFYDLNDTDGLIALCTLSAANWGIISKKEDLEGPCRRAVRALDNLLSYQDYPAVQAKEFTRKYRALGIGIIGFAHFLAKRGLGYDKASAAVVDEYMEAMAYYLIDESCRLAEERGRCEGFDELCYAEGKFTWEYRNPNIDKIVPHKLRYDWEELRARIKKFGIRNATLMAIAPTETSSQLTGETNGIEPPVSVITEKLSKDGQLKAVVPEVHRLKNKYTYRWDMKTPMGYLTLMAVLQKWIDQSISTNASYNPELFENGKIPASRLVKDFVYYYTIGGKNFYYCNTKDGSGEEAVNETQQNQTEVIEEDCESCKV